MVNINNKSIGVLGGSFDPAHKGHLGITKIAIKKINLNKVIWLIAQKNPLKDKPFYSVAERLYKAKKLIKSSKKIKIMYLDKILGSSRSIDAINYLINKKKLKKIYFIIGSDNLIEFHKWKSWKKIVRLTKLTVFSREGYDRKGKNSVVAKYLKNNIIFINNKHISVSSTNLRKQAQIEN